MNREIYLDNNATTRPLPEVRETMLEVLDIGYGNPSSAHGAGERARIYLSKAREALADLIEVDAHNLFFVSGATEANNMILTSILKRQGNNSRIITTEIEHSSIFKLCEYLRAHSIDIVTLPVNKKGHISLSDLAKEIISKRTDLVSVQWVNNETGVMQPVDEIGKICKINGVPFHTDAAQAVGKLNMTVQDLPIDFLSISGHKFHGPQGIGAIYARNPKYLLPILYGGSQESSLRPGTENLPGIVGIGKAAQIRHQHLKSVIDKIKCLRDEFEQLILINIPNVEVNGDRDQRVHNTTNLLFHGIEGQALIARLNNLNIYCSQSSACTNQSPESSYVLRAMGLTDDEGFSSIRFSFSEFITREDVLYVVEEMKAICEDLSKFSLTKNKKASFNR
jgi:cysteine desulfurase